MLKRCKASFMIFLIVISIFMISLAKPVSAADACCERTIVGTSCIYTANSNCDSAFNILDSSCESTSFCQIGCCVDNNGGCHVNVAKATCLEAGGGWSLNCNEGECEKNCCVVSGECSYVTERRCDNIIASYGITEFDFRDVGSEQECVDVCRGDEEGCCVDDFGCEHTNRDDCEGDFNYGQYCSGINSCNAESHSRKECYEDDVYWFDSLGNREDLVEECNYNDGFICGEVNGDYACKSVDCSATYNDDRNVHDQRIGGFRENGESWCIYESPVGDFRDRPGTRHYRHMCVNGEEFYEPCRDYREEICVQGESNGFTESNCLYNDIYDSEINSNISTVPLGSKFWERDESCDAASIECKVVYVKESRFDSMDCEHNCECETQEWTDKVGEYCRSLGDCGADFNVLGVKSEGGFVMENAPKNISQGKWENWSQYGVFGSMEILSNAGAGLWKGSVDEPSGGYIEASIGGGITYAIIWVYQALKIMSLSASAGPVGLIVGAVVSLIVWAIFSGGDTKTIVVKSTCSAWQAPDGGSDCEECGEIYGDCTEYRCKSLGKLCEFIPENSGSDKVSCYNSHPNDVNSPRISPWEEILSQGYNIQTTQAGYKINPKIEPFSIITFGIETDEMAQCKFDIEHTTSYDEMNYYFGDSYYGKKHNISMNLENGKKYDFYVRCKDPNGNGNLNEYSIQIETREGPDLTTAVIDYFEPNDGSFVGFGVNETVVSAYVNEPVDCKWSYNDITYGIMNNPFACEKTININEIYYECLTVMDVSQGGNTYYVRCKDMSNNTNQESFTYGLYGSDELRISSLSPNGTLYDTNSPMLQLRTEGGVDGDAICYFGSDNSTWIEFFNTNTAGHSQPLLNLNRGDYIYYVKCIDEVNEDYGRIEFRIDSDTTGPVLTYVFSDNSLLHITLNEDASCEYSNSSFSFGQGTSMTNNGLEHSAPLQGYHYINCEDNYGNEMGIVIIYP